VKARGLSNLWLKVAGLVLVTASAVGTAVGLKGLPADLATADVSRLTTVVLVEAVSWVAIPIYAWLLYWGFVHTRSVARYAARLAVLAVVAEVPYDLATSGRLWDVRSQNPVFALLVAVVVLWALDRLRQGGVRRVGLSVLLCVAGVLWLVIFNVGLRLGVMPAGVVLLLFCLVFYALHSRENTMMAVGGILGAVALVFPAAGMVVLHFRNETPGRQYPRYLFYVLYPACLLAAGVLGRLS
jgi:hypothetical protein